MRVYISADMEGISGVVHAAQTEPGAREYDRACALMVGDVNAAVAGAVAGGATRVLVNDSHWNMRNIPLEALHPAAELISGSPKPWSMVQGVDEGFDLMFCVGYHAMSGTPQATIDHTFTEDSAHRVFINDLEVGELGLNGYFAGQFGVPVVFVSGDQQLAAEARALLGAELVAVEVKHAYSRSAARLLPLAESRKRIEEGSRVALTRAVRPLVAKPPITIRVELMKSSQADTAALAPGVVRSGGRTVSFTHAEYAEVYRAWRAIYNLAGV